MCLVVLTSSKKTSYCLLLDKKYYNFYLIFQTYTVWLTSKIDNKNILFERCSVDIILPGGTNSLADREAIAIGRKRGLYVHWKSMRRQLFEMLNWMLSEMTGRVDDDVEVDWESNPVAYGVEWMTTISEKKHSGPYHITKSHIFTSAEEGTRRLSLLVPSSAEVNMCDFVILWRPFESFDDTALKRFPSPMLGWLHRKHKNYATTAVFSHAAAHTTATSRSRLHWGRHRSLQLITQSNLYDNYLRQGGYVFVAVCVSCVYVCVQNISERYERILMNFFGGVGHGPIANRLNSGGSWWYDPHPGFHDPDPRFLMDLDQSPDVAILENFWRNFWRDGTWPQPWRRYALQRVLSSFTQWKWATYVRACTRACVTVGGPLTLVLSIITQ